MSTQNSNNFPKGFAAAHTPQAEDDYASDWNNAGIFIDVLSNDLGGAAKSLYSIDQSDPLTAETIAQSALGTTITIVDGKIYYDPTTNPAFADLSAGQTVTDSFTYAMQLGNGTISTATVYVTVTGTNVAPVAVADTSSVKEDTNTPTQPNPVSGNVLANDTDANALDTHSVAAVNGQAANVGANVAGSYGTLRLNADGSYTYTLDNSKASAQALAEGQKAFDIFTYTNSDNHGGTGSTTLTITVFGTDDAPTVSAGPPSATLVEQGAGVPGVATSVVNLTTGDVDGAASYDTTGWTQLSPTTFKMDAIYGYVVLDTAANTMTYSLDDTRPATDELIQGQKVSDNFTVNVKESDGSLTAFTPVTFSITGADDAPTVSASVPSVTLVEQGTGVPGVATSVVNLTIGDVDGAASYDTTGWTQLSPTTFKMDAIYGYAVLDSAVNTLTYSLDNTRPATDGLIQGQQVSDNFTVNVKESDGSLTTSLPVDFTITGSNDAPMIIGEQGTKTVTEDEPQGTSGGMPSGLDATLTADGAISFIDPDFSDEHHTVNVTAIGSNYLGAMQANIAHETLHSGTGGDEIGIVSWDYSVLNANLQFLSQGEEVDQAYTITVMDDHGGTTTQDITVRLFGNNDLPTVTADASTGALDETPATPAPGEQLSKTGSFAFGDVDLLDTHTIGSPTFVNMGPNLTSQVGQLSAILNQDGASVSWTYAVDAAAVEYLGQGQQLVESFLVPITDNWGGTVDKLVQVTVNGSDDAPTVSASVPSVTLVEQGTGVPGVATSVVNLTIGDVDGAASYDTTGWTQLSPTTFKMDAIYGYAVLDTAANTLIYTLDDSRPVTDGLTQDQQVSDNFTVNVKETDGSLNASTPVSFTILGTDDLNNIAPVLSDFSSVSYLGAPILVTTDANGIHSNSDAAFDFSFSPDGTSIAFSDLGSNLVLNDTNGSYDIFVKNLATGAITRVSTEINGGQTNGNSSIPVYSPDGSKLAFISLGTNLVPGDTNNTHQDIFADGQDVFVKDLTTGAITLVSSNANGVPGDHDSYGATFSPDGTEVAFYSLASNLDPVADAAVNYFSNGVDPDIFIKNLVTGAISLVAPDSNSGGWNYSGELPAFSPDGNVLLLDSSANLTAGSNFNEQVYTKDLTTGTFRLISSDANGVAGNGQSFESVFSPDGTKVAFMSTSSNLVSDDTNGTPDIFIKDLVTGAISRVSTDANGMQANSSSIGPVFSPDGTAVTFDSVATNLVPGDTNNVVDVFWKNLLTGDIARVSTTAAGLQANAGSSGLTAFTPDGTKIAFWSEANNLVPNDTNSGPNFFGSDVFVRPMLSASGAVIDNPLQQFLTTEDTFKFSDLNVGDVHSVSVVAQPGALGTLSATVTHDSTGTGTGGTVTWDYQVAESIVHGLSAPTTDAFTATVSDGQGGTASVALHIALLPHDLLV